MLHHWMSESWTESAQRCYLPSVSTSSQRCTSSTSFSKISALQNGMSYIFGLIISLDVMRFRRWIQVCNNENVAKRPPMVVYKQYRICRRHFDASSKNGGCRRLLKTAVPSLHLNLGQTCADAENDDDEEDIDLPMETEALEENSIDEMNEDSNIRDPSSFDLFEIKYDSLIPAAKSSQRRDIREYLCKIKIFIASNSFRCSILV